MDSPLKAAANLAPPLSKHKLQLPWTIDFLMAILEQLDPNDPLHVAVNSCLLTTFYTAACLSKFTLCNLTYFDPQLHVTPAAIFEDINCNGLKSTGFDLPKTKTGGPKDVSWSAQTNLKAALKRHLMFNKPPPSGHYLPTATGANTGP